MGIKSKKEDRIRRGLFWEWSGGGSGTLEKGETGAENASLLSFFLNERAHSTQNFSFFLSSVFCRLTMEKRGGKCSFTIVVAAAALLFKE